MSDSVWPHRWQPTRLPCPWVSPGKNTGVGCHCLLQCMKVVKVKLLSCVQLFGTPWTAAYQAPPSMGFSRQEYWSGLSLPSPGDLPDPGIELKDQTWVSRLGGRCFNLWTVLEGRPKALNSQLSYRGRMWSRCFILLHKSCMAMSELFCAQSE